MIKKYVIYLILTPVIAFGIPPNNEKILSSRLKGLEKFLGKTYKGEFLNSSQENPLFDMMFWERALNGNAVRILHSVNEGEYGGETIIMWNPDKNKLYSWYFNTGGSQSEGTVEIDTDHCLIIENVSKNKNGIKKVKTIYKYTRSGEINCKVKYFINNIWFDAHNHLYKQIDKKLIFK